MGKYEELLERLQPHLNHSSYHHDDQIFVDSLRALALEHTGKQIDALLALAQAEATATTVWPDPSADNDVSYGTLGRYALAKTLLVEAQKLIHSNNSESNPDAKGIGEP